MKMFLRLIVTATLLLAPANVFADSTTDLKNMKAAEIAEMSGRVKIANGLIAMGRKDGDAQFIALGARILSELKVDVVDPATVKEGSKPELYNARALLDSIVGLEGGKEAAMIFKLSPIETKQGRTICYWNSQCTSSYCGEFWDCGGY